VNRTEATLKRLGKTYEFHRYDGAGHAFFNTTRVAYRPSRPPTVGKNLRVPAQDPRGVSSAPNESDQRRQSMCSYIVETARYPQRQGPSGWMRIDTANVYFDHPYHAPLDHALASTSSANRMARASVSRSSCRPPRRASW